MTLYLYSVVEVMLLRAFSSGISGAAVIGWVTVVARAGVAVALPFNLTISQQHTKRPSFTHDAHLRHHAQIITHVDILLTFDKARVTFLLPRLSPA
jgi:hypothetical protein